MKRLLPTFALPFLVAAGAFAQTNFTTFNNVQSISGINVTPLGSGSYQVSLDSGATVLGADGVTYHINDIFGFFALADGSPIAATGTNVDTWSFVLDNSQGNDPGRGGVAGWQTNPPNGIMTGGSETFTFTTGPTPFTDWGFHVRVDEDNFLGTSGNTANITVGAVPEPASMAALGVGAIGLLARRRRKNA